MAKREYFVDLDLGGNKIENFRIESLDSLPNTLGDADVGRIVYQGGFLHIWSGTGWETISAFEGEDATGIPFTTALKEQLTAAYTAVTAIGDNALVKQGALDTALDGKVDKVEGSTLMTSDERAKIGNLAADANTTYATKAELGSYATTTALNNGLVLKADDSVVVKSVNSKTPVEGAVTLAASDVGALANTVKYAADVTATPSGDNTTVQLKDQDGNAIGSSFTITQKTYSEATTAAAGLMSAADKTKLDGVATGAQVNVIESITVDGVAQAVSGKAVALNLENYAKKTDISSVYKYAGSVTNYSELPTTGLTKGDVYNVANANGNIPAGTNYVWDGTAWDALAGIVDLSAYAKTADVATSITNATKDLASTEALNGAKSELQTAIDGKVAQTAYDTKVAAIEADIAKKADAVTVAAGSYTKVTVNAQGIVTSGAALAAADIPEIGADKITSGTLAAARLPFAIGSAKVPAITISGGSATVAHGLGCVPVSVMVTRTADGVVVYPAVAVDATNITISSNLVTSAEQFTVSWVG